MEKFGGTPRQWLGRFLRDKHISSKDRAAHELRYLCDVVEEAACFDQVNLGALACLEVTARRLNLIVDADKQGGAPSHVNAKYLTPLAGTDEILAPALRAHLSRRAREDWEVMQCAKKADAAAAMTDLTTYDDDGGNDGKQGCGIGKGQGKKGQGFLKVGAPPAEKWYKAGSGRGSPRAGRQLDPMQPHFPVSPCDLHIFPLPVARLRRV